MFDRYVNGLVQQQYSDEQKSIVVQSFTAVNDVISRICGDPSAMQNTSKSLKPYHDVIGKVLMDVKGLIKM